MRERPILFSAPMVRAILAGTKTQTRRVVIERETWPDQSTVYEPYSESDDDVPEEYRGGAYEWGAIGTNYGQGSYGVGFPCPYAWNHRDRLWVREAWSTPESYDHMSPRDLDRRCPLLYRADGSHGQWAAWLDPDQQAGRTRAAFHMPRWASRLTLEVTAVRVERVQDISGDDALAEGVSVELPHFMAFAGEYYNHDEIQQPAREAFRKLWDSINAKRGYGWAANPWVWVVEFRRVEG